MSSIGQANDLAAYATPELRHLFEEWVEQLEGEIEGFIKENGITDPETVSKKFSLSKESVSFLINRLNVKGKIHIKAEAGK